METSFDVNTFIGKQIDPVCNFLSYQVNLLYYFGFQTQDSLVRIVFIEVESGGHHPLFIIQVFDPILLGLKGVLEPHHSMNNDFFKNLLTVFLISFLIFICAFYLVDDLSM